MGNIQLSKGDEVHLSQRKKRKKFDVLRWAIPPPQGMLKYQTFDILNVDSKTGRNIET